MRFCLPIIAIVIALCCWLPPLLPADNTEPTLMEPPLPAEMVARACQAGGGRDGAIAAADHDDDDDRNLSATAHAAPETAPAATPRGERLAEMCNFASARACPSSEPP